MNLRHALPSRPRRLLLVALTVACLAPSVRAFVFEIGDVKGSLDTTLSVGGLYRLDDPDKQYYGVSAGGLQRSELQEGDRVLSGEGQP
jgi:hypothetical protein